MFTYAETVRIKNNMEPKQTQDYFWAIKRMVGMGSRQKRSIKLRCPIPNRKDLLDRLNSSTSLISHEVWLLENTDSRKR